MINPRLTALFYSGNITAKLPISREFKNRIAGEILEVENLKESCFDNSIKWLVFMAGWLKAAGHISKSVLLLHKAKNLIKEKSHV